MSLITSENGDVTLSKSRQSVCMEVAYEIESLAYMLAGLPPKNEVDEMHTVFAARGIAGRCVALAGVLMAALSDETEETGCLSRTVHVTYRGGVAV